MIFGKTFGLYQFHGNKFRWTYIVLSNNEMRYTPRKKSLRKVRKRSISWTYVVTAGKTNPLAKLQR